MSVHYIDKNGEQVHVENGFILDAEENRIIEIGENKVYHLIRTNNLLDELYIKIVDTLSQASLDDLDDDTLDKTSSAILSTISSVVKGGDKVDG